MNLVLFRADDIVTIPLRRDAGGIAAKRPILRFCAERQDTRVGAQADPVGLSDRESSIPVRARHPGLWIREGGSASGHPCLTGEFLGHDGGEIADHEIDEGAYSGGQAAAGGEIQADRA